ncbi:AraC family transcriptional regulator [Paenarthrobacter sp. NPDC018779]|uniref:AraC family transcriptional regulator n=1 Tax=Paenarthrobacter sp. NPDC018779 TaxID=3364375 RepID=UPI0037C89EE5
MSVIRHEHKPKAPTRSQVLAAGGIIDAHSHDEHQIIYAGAGVLAITTTAGTWFTPGTSAIWVPAGTVHAHRAQGHLELHMLGVPAGLNPLGTDEPTLVGVSPLLRELIIAYTHNPQDTSEERERLFHVLLDQLRASPREPIHLPTATDPRLAEVCHLLETNPADGRTLAQLGTAVAVGERTLSRLFKAEFGMTFPQWRTQLRLYNALRMLAEGKAVTTVAHHCGWSSTSAFIDVFRRAYGYTPGTHNRPT